jgi:CO/xanthine dehydrogenase FAD-binding subunit
MIYARPATLDEAVAQRSGGGSVADVPAGGTHLSVQMTAGKRKRDIVADIKRIPELTATTCGDAGFHIASAVCGAELNEHAALRTAWPGFREGMDFIGSMQVQNKATPAGNLCTRSPAADSVPGMIAAGATATVAGRTGRPEVPVAEIPRRPWPHDACAGRTDRGDPSAAAPLPCGRRL